jgi:hypothetical protein
MRATKFADKKKVNNAQVPRLRSWKLMAES